MKQTNKKLNIAKQEAELYGSRMIYFENTDSLRTVKIKQLINLLRP